MTQLKKDRTYKGFPGLDWHKPGDRQRAQIVVEVEWFWERTHEWLCEWATLNMLVEPSDTDALDALQAEMVEGSIHTTDEMETGEDGEDEVGCDQSPFSHNDEETVND